MASPRRITRLIASSAPISQRTGTPAFGMPPPGTSGSGASFDQMTKPSAAGEPEATPSANGSALNTGLAMARDSAASPRNRPRAPAERADHIPPVGRHEGENVDRFPR